MKKRFLLALLGMNLAFMSLPSQAAEKVIVKYSVLSETVSVPELSQLSRTGEASPAIAAYLKLANKSPEDLRGWLNQSVNINAATLSDILNSFLGKLILDQVVQVIYTPLDHSSIESLRQALISAATNDNKISLIELLESYPTPEIQIEADKLMELYQKLKETTARLTRLPN